MKYDMKDSNKTYRDDFGLLVKEVTEVTDLDSGAVQEVHETHREEVPMRLEERVTRMLARIPVEEKTEVFRVDGSVETKIKSLPENSLDSLDLKEDKFSESDQNVALVLKRLEALEGRDKQLERKLDQLLARKAQHAAECKAKAQAQARVEQAPKDQVGVDFGKKAVVEKKAAPVSNGNNDVLKALARLAAKVDKLEQKEAPVAEAKAPFMRRAAEKYSDEPSSTPTTPSTPVTEEPGTVEKVVAGLGWIAFAIVGGLVVLALL